MGKLGLVKLQLDGRYYEDAVSRTYYSMFYAARAIRTLKNIEPKTHEGSIVYVWASCYKRK